MQFCGRKGKLQEKGLLTWQLWAADHKLFQACGCYFSTSPGVCGMPTGLTMSTCIGFLTRTHTCKAPFRRANLAQYQRRASIMTQARTTRKEQLVDCKKAVAEHLKKTHCMPIMIRLAWHDSGTYDKVRLCRRIPAVRDRLLHILCVSF